VASDQQEHLTEEPTAGESADALDPQDAPVVEADSAAPDAAPEADSAPEAAESDETVAAAEVDEADAAAVDDSVAEKDEDEEEDDDGGQPVEVAAEDEVPPMDWYILKVQSNRENSIAEALQRRVKVEGLEDLFGEIVVPSEMVTEFKGGKKKVVKRKLYPGYIVVHMAINDDTWFVVRETPGIGDFTGAGGKPTPMLPHEVQRIITKPEEATEEAPRLKIGFGVGDRVKIIEGNFESFEGEVGTIDDASGRITVMIQIFNRTTPVELEHWQVETL
jgi:transcriptional antiterminator NusG